MKTVLGKEECFIVQVLYENVGTLRGQQRQSNRSYFLVNNYLYQEIKRLQLISITY